MKNKFYLAIGIISVLTILLIVFFNSSGKTKLLGADFVNQFNNTPEAVLLDVRTPSEFASGHLESAVNIDFESKTFISEIKNLDPIKTYFVYCRSGNRSAQAISLMKQNGFNNIIELDGGIVSNSNSLQLVTTNSSDSDYVVDASDMVDGKSLIDGIAKSELSEKEISGLVLMREEEKLARDVYTVLGETWGTKIFSNISASEQTHSDAMKVLLDRYDIKDPVTSNSIGSFTSPVIKELYDKFIAQGKTSLKEALFVGATIEDLDIRDLEVLKKETSREDILITYNNLQKGSRNHLRAYVKNLQSNGGSYTPQYISQSEYSTIINAAQERGGF